MTIEENKNEEVALPENESHEVENEEEIHKFLRKYPIPPHHKELIDSLPAIEGMGGITNYQYKGFWLEGVFLVSTLSCHERFQARNTDIYLASYPKTGTTWLKALSYAVFKRAHFPDLKNHPLLTSNPHELVKYLEHEYVGDNSPEIEREEHQRLLATHLPFVLLPTSVVEKGCKIVYVYRNPKDAFLSYWKFFFQLFPDKMAKTHLQEEASKFAKGISPHGPFWDHVLGYWKQKNNRILFLRYEEMKKDPMEVVRKLAEFFECPFSPAEEEDGMVEKIVNLCSFDHLSNLDVNRNEKLPTGTPNRVFFRRGEVGDSANYLSPENDKLMDQVTEERFRDSCLVI